ncbi:UBA/TS-N domain containing protein [Trichomonas vaginalis G3]|uniref:UBA/TS-N domain containing protein n=1 Tax=Trichomonas vaginalis (strain ATCC PRA-98 / G3) TaxID=412133 RepID=A2E2H4_TRIV3|nr:UBA-like family [Trichomonas vaginalis G3]EAY13149.1 UBA/TS-N domain containing protein [Trichomonas vaginalis G3]KAI5528263.1 UBA-like family [Trichomonas vaginalis G3]|eukprot:XP_001325372.1 UBA/TS-N domain containing protein [Trichomonas vaginalis G3]
MNVSFQGKSYAVTRTTKSILDLKVYLSKKTHVPMSDMEIYKKNKLLPDEYKLDSAEKEKEITLECKINEKQTDKTNNEIISYQVDPEKVKYLTNMGFTSRQVTAALNITKGDADKAVFILKQTATPK